MSDTVLRIVDRSVSETIFFQSFSFLARLHLSAEELLLYPIPGVRVGVRKQNVRASLSVFIEGPGVYLLRARGGGGKSRMCPPYPQCVVKGDSIGRGAVCRNHRIKRLVPCRCLDGHVKEPYEMSMALGADHRSNFFFNSPAHLCAVTYMTEISFHVTLNNQFNSTQIQVSLYFVLHFYFAGYTNKAPYNKSSRQARIR